MIVDPEYRRGSLCETYGHDWRPANEPGMFQCSTCRAMGYCPGCVLIMPKGVLMMRCKQHQAKQEEAKRDA